MVGWRPPEVSVPSAAETGEELLSPLTESRLSAIQLEHSIQSSRPSTAAASPHSTGSPGAPTPRAVVGARLPGSGTSTPNETEEERELREAFELDEMLVCGVGLGELLRWQQEEEVERSRLVSAQELMGRALLAVEPRHFAMIAKLRAPPRILCAVLEMVLILL